MLSGTVRNGCLEVVLSDMLAPSFAIPVPAYCRLTTAFRLLLHRRPIIGIDQGSIVFGGGPHF